MISRNFIFTIPFILALVGGVLSISEKNPSNIIGWSCFLGLTVFLVVNQKNGLLAKLLSIAAGWFIFLGIRTIVLGIKSLFLSDYSAEIAGSFVAAMIGVSILSTGVALYMRKKKALFFASIISVLFFASEVNGIIQSENQLTELPFNDILSLVIWIFIISILSLKTIRKEPKPNL